MFRLKGTKWQLRQISSANQDCCEFMWQLLRWQQWEQSQRGMCAGDNPREPCCNPLGCATELGDAEAVLETWRGAVGAALNPLTHWLSEALVWSAALSQSNKDKNRTHSFPVGHSAAHLVCFFHQVDFVQFQDDSKVYGFPTHSAWFFVEVHLLKDLWNKHRNHWTVILMMGEKT